MKRTRAPEPLKTVEKRRRYEDVKTLHDPEPDYTRPVFSFSPQTLKRIRDRLTCLYGEKAAGPAIEELIRISRVHAAHKPGHMLEREQKARQKDRFSQEDAVLITYGDLIRGDDPSPLTTLSKFCGLNLAQAFNTLHILPFFPYSSDRGFSVIDFETVDPNLGSWTDIENIEQRYMLMFDGVINHVSAKSRWFKEFLNCSPQYKDFFTAFKTRDELSHSDRKMVFRPRTSDILTEYLTIDGPRHVWTTFSPDQIDLNYRNPQVLLKVLEILLFYVRRGADLIRLDAVTYLWDEPGTTCAHLPQTHEIVRLLHDVLGEAAPRVALVIEANTTQEQNLAYFGSGQEEAHMVYNFDLPPLVLHTFYTGDATRFGQWLENLKTPMPCACFFNILDSHDGVGLLGAQGVLEPGEIDHLVKEARERGALISWRTSENGEKTPYELNATWYSAINGAESPEPEDLQVARFLASRSLALIIPGVPAVYIHSLFGTANDIEAVSRTEINRDINRKTLNYDAVVKALEYPQSRTGKIAGGLMRLMAARTKNPAFHPAGGRKVLGLDTKTIAILRTSPDNTQRILCLTNVTAKTTNLEIPLAALETEENRRWTDILGETRSRRAAGNLMITLKPYAVAWMVEA